MSSANGSVSGLNEVQQIAVQSQIQFSIMAKQLEAQRQTGQAVTDLLDSALQLSKEAGKGESFDGSV